MDILKKGDDFDLYIPYIPKNIWADDFYRLNCQQLIDFILKREPFDVIDFFNELKKSIIPHFIVIGGCFDIRCSDKVEALSYLLSFVDDKTPCPRVYRKTSLASAHDGHQEYYHSDKPPFGMSCLGLEAKRLLSAILLKQDYPCSIKFSNKKDIELKIKTLP